MRNARPGRNRRPVDELGPDDEFEYDPLRVAGGILTGQINDPETVQLAAYLVMASHRDDPAIEPQTPDETIAALRQLQTAGLIGVGPNGAAYMGEPIIGPLGNVIGCRQIVGMLPGEIAELMRAREMGDTSIAFRSPQLMTGPLA